MPASAGQRAPKQTRPSALRHPTGPRVTIPFLERGTPVKVYEGKDIRNVGVVGHGDSGKTTLTAGLLFTSGATNRLLRVDEGNTITDFDEEEVQRKKVWEFADHFKLPRAIVINKLERERADFKRALESVNEFFGRTAVPIHIPMGSERDFKGVV